MVDDFSKKIDITDSQLVLQYGAAAQKSVASFSESALSNVRNKDLGEVGDTLNTLLSYSTRKDEIEIAADPERLRPIDADLQVPDCTKFKEHTGWEPEIRFETTMHDLLDYWRDRVKKGEVFLRR